MQGEDYHPIKEVFEGDFERRGIHPVDPNICTFEAAKQRVDAWREAGRFTVTNAGTYDLLTLNHKLNLIQCRMIGAASLLGMREQTIPRSELTKVQTLAAAGNICLMITLDTDDNIRANKSRRPENGGAEKPILSWRSRAAAIATEVIPTPDYDFRRTAVDYITRHGPDACAVCAAGECPSSDNAALTIGLKPDLVVINSSSTDTRDKLLAAQSEGTLPDTTLRFNVEHENQFHDDLLGGPIKTTDIIRRIKR